jgi:hypothetical protein
MRLNLRLGRKGMISQERKMPKKNKKIRQGYFASLGGFLTFGH